LVRDVEFSCLCPIKKLRTPTGGKGIADTQATSAVRRNMLKRMFGMIFKQVYEKVDFGQTASNAKDLIDFC